MNKKKMYVGMLGSLTALLMAGGMSSCGMISDDLEPCTVSYRVKFNYDYNIKNADAFNSEVRSIQVWAFDTEGKLAWQSEASGDALKSPDFSITADLQPGTYTFLAWGGLSQDSPFTLTGSSSPKSIEDLGCRLTLKKDGNDNPYADYRMENGLYHGLVENVELKRFENQNAVQTVTVPLMKDSKEIAVMLQHINGTPIDSKDFSISIKAANSNLAWNNAVLSGPSFSYFPWAISYGSASKEKDTRTQTSVNTLLAELATSRIMVDSDQVLSVVRLTDNVEIIRIPLVQYLLLVKGNYHKNYSDQEYLDRQDEYSMVFFLTEDNNWYISAGIYINSWAVVPPQVQ